MSTLLAEYASSREIGDRVWHLTDLTQCASVIASLIPSTLTPACADAVAIIPGCGQRERIDEGMGVATRAAVKTVIVAGQNAEEIVQYGLLKRDFIFRQTMPTLPDAASTPSRDPQWIVAHEVSWNSKEQARFVLAVMQERKITSCLITAPGWHLIPGLYLTFVATALEMQFYPKLFPFPVASLAEMKPLSQIGYNDVLEAAEGELVRCLEKYSKDVASLEQLQEYLKKAGLL